MELLNARIKYVCSNSDCDFQTYMTEEINGSPKKLGYKIFPSKMCPKCHNTLKVAIIKTIALIDKYGDKEYGKWKCHVHNSIEYYPLPIQLAEQKQLVPLTQWSLHNDYVSIAKGGYPWRCPKCKRPLEYKYEQFT